MRIVLTVEYDGTDFIGWQIQAKGRSVQQVIEDGIYELTGERVNLVGSGRTDSGVHAKGQVAHFDTESKIPPEKFATSLNGVLPKDVKIIKSELKNDDFHARFSAKKKTYLYRTYFGTCDSPLKSRYAVRLAVKVDIEKMRNALKYFIGEHDFKCFLASNSSVKDTVRTVYGAELYEDGEYLCFKVCGNGFLYNMVRIMMGTLVKVGEGKISAEEVGKIIDGKERSLAGKTMPPEGLTLLSVEYD